MRGRVSSDQLAFSFDEPTTAALPYTVVCDDVLRWAETYTGPPFMAMICDPPYHLQGVIDSRARSGNPENRGQSSAPFAANGKGFMGQKWDGGDVAFKPETWKALAQHLLPGAFILAFGSSRGWHRLACAMEDAGLRIMPSIFNWRTGETHEIGMYGWANGSSFPKATRIDVAVDKAAGMEQEIIGYRDSRSDYDGCERNSRAMNDGWRAAEGRTDISDLSQKPITAPATPLAQIWAGHRYGGQVLKNSLEPIIVAQVPYAGKPVESIVTHGSGALNIDGGRISWASERDHQKTLYDLSYMAKSPSRRAGVNHEGWHRPWMEGDGNGEQLDRTLAQTKMNTGRWPPNFVLQHVSLPVLRLKGHLPPDTQDAITRYYAGYTAVSTLRAGRNGAVHHGLEVLAGDIPDGWHEYFELTGEDLGCVAQGTRQVRGSHDTTGIWGGQHDQAFVGGWKPDVPHQGYTDANGLETIPAWACHESCPVRKLDLQAGERPPPWGKGTSISQTPSWKQSNAERPIDNGQYQDGSNASRFFHVSSWSLDVAERLAQADPALYCAKASRGERDSGLGGVEPRRKNPDAEIIREYVHPVPEGLGAWLAAQRLASGLSHHQICARGGFHGEVNHGGASSNWESGANRPTPEQWLKLKEILGFDDRYDCAMTETREVTLQERMERSTAQDIHLTCRLSGTDQPQRNPHPTVKPIKLTQWLATLLLPPAAYAPRRLLNVFSGSGSEGIGAMLAGWDEIVMVDSDQSYVDIAEQRLAYWSTHRGATP